MKQISSIIITGTFLIFALMHSSCKKDDPPTAIVDVTNPITGRTWMDRNLGASRAATSSTDSMAYGDLYQWGRLKDGHQHRTSDTTSILSTMDSPGHSAFIILLTFDPAGADPMDWRSPQNDSLWQGVNGVNNPCPIGYRLPTEAEWQAEISSWSSQDAAGAFNSTLKLPLAGTRNTHSAVVVSDGSWGCYWTCDIEDNRARLIVFRDIAAGAVRTARAQGYSVRCIKN